MKNIKKFFSLLGRKYKDESDPVLPSRHVEWLVDLILFKIERNLYWECGVFNIRFLLFRFAVYWGFNSLPRFFDISPWFVAIRLGGKSLFFSISFGVSQLAFLEYKTKWALSKLSPQKLRELRKIFEELLKEVER